ncbi:branched-chain amino acid ABC transporter substrate-binding protein [Paraburkholderia sp. C35]|uniref:branched-chain amino acid ABC transporter substrate-binding protein n=1 Tax=Paraburkholderia sp. C35 TaxID=2126993 RepID=UPI000D69AA9F|nr:branched-chain amino acid ABC transporter substrate-binding protein [Paraburkholderia sp. C35]
MSWFMTTSRHFIGGAVIALGALSCQGTQAEDVIVVRIGFAAPLTGPSAADGKEMENAARFAIEDANDRHPRIAERPVSFELVPLDDQADPRIASQVAQRFADMSVAGVVGHFNSGCSIAASNVYDGAQIAEVSPSSTSAAYTLRGKRSSFRVVGQDAVAGAELGRYIVEDLQARRVAIIDDRTDFGAGLADHVSEFISQRHVAIVAREYVTDKTVDFSAVLTRIRSQNADVVVFGGFDAQAGQIVRRMRSLGMNATLAGEGFNNNTFLNLAHGDGEGTVTIQPGLPSDKMPAKDFASRYEARFKAKMEGFQGPYTYDATSVIVQAVLTAQSAKAADVLQAVRKTSMSGLTGPIAFDNNGDLAAAPYTVYRLAGDRWIDEKVFVARGK